MIEILYDPKFWASVFLAACVVYEDYTKYRIVYPRVNKRIIQHEKRFNKNSEIILCLDCNYLEEPCHIKELLSNLGFFDENNICKFFEPKLSSVKRQQK